MTDISIIVPVYNAEKYLKKCLDSLVNQTKKELEFILINDGSTGKSEEIVKTYKDERIKYFKNKNQGIGKTRNFGIEKATGK
ncbi:MAG: glycosyltransferase family A protein, partial [bacterium]|nr:glycosyltransferase family A protein [bacterium]